MIIDKNITYAKNLKQIIANDKNGFMTKHPKHAAIIATMTAFGRVCDVSDEDCQSLSAQAIGAFANHCSQIRIEALKEK